MSNGDRQMASNLELFPLLDECFTEAQRSAERMIKRGEPQEWAYRTAYTAYIGQLESLVSHLTRGDSEKTEAAYKELGNVLTSIKKFG